jgi:hypothetical protein
MSHRHPAQPMIFMRISVGFKAVELSNLNENTILSPSPAPHQCCLYLVSKCSWRPIIWGGKMTQRVSLSHCITLVGSSKWPKGELEMRRYTMTIKEAGLQLQVFIKYGSLPRILIYRWLLRIFLDSEKLCRISVLLFYTYLHKHVILKNAIMRLCFLSRACFHLSHWVTFFLLKFNTAIEFNSVIFPTLIIDRSWMQ